MQMPIQTPTQMQLMSRLILAADRPFEVDLQYYATLLSLGFDFQNKSRSVVYSYFLAPGETLGFTSLGSLHHWCQPPTHPQRYDWSLCVSNNSPQAQLVVR